MSVSPTGLSIFALCILKICCHVYIHSACLLEQLTLCQQEMFLFIFRNIFILYDCNIAVSPFSFLLFVYLFFTHPFIFIRSVSLYLKSVSCSQHIVLSLCFSLILIGLNITIIGSHWFSIFLLFLFFCS